MVVPVAAHWSMASVAWLGSQSPARKKHLPRVHFGKNVLFNPGRVDETVSGNASFGERSSTLETFGGQVGELVGLHAMALYIGMGNIEMERVSIVLLMWGGGQDWDREGIGWDGIWAGVAGA